MRAVTDHVSGRLSDLDRQVVQAVPAGGNWRDLPADFPSRRIDQIRRGAANGDGTRSTYYGRLTWDRPSYTVSTFFSRPGNGCYIHPSAPRLITLREAARLQTFPDAYRFSGKGRARFLQIGNAVPPLLAYQLAQALGTESFADLFCGAGGLSLGFELNGATNVAAVDHDAAACETLRQNASDPDLVIRADLTDDHAYANTLRTIRNRAGRDGVETVIGGPPCQGFSTAGNCRLDDPRNALVHVFIDAVTELRPRTVLFENVAALLWRRRRPILDGIRASLDRLGFNTSIILAHAEGYGVPQLRRRVFLIGNRDKQPRWPIPWRSVSEPWYPDYQPGFDASQEMPAPSSVRDAISDLPEEEADHADSPISYRSAPTSPLQCWARGKLSIDKLVPPLLFAMSPKGGQIESARLFDLTATA